MYEIFLENVQQIQLRLLIILSVVLCIKELYGSHISTQNDELIFSSTNETLPSWSSYYKKTNGEAFNPQIDNHGKKNEFSSDIVLV
ncbi:unnamed protein product [Trichobilharzia regenti]|nr:unnamed protein product [Trichobilharzia regenti]